MRTLPGKIHWYTGTRTSKTSRMKSWEVASSGGVLVRNYPELVEAYSRIAFRNYSCNLFFRGQITDYKIVDKKRKAKISSIRASIYRKGPQKLDDRISDLNVFSEKLLRSWNVLGGIRLGRWKELQWALLQHYGVCNTPLLDITQSLRVAASFACPVKAPIECWPGNYAYVYMFALPRVSGSISIHPDDHIAIVRLSSLCPPDAKRPHYQEGYLVGDYPEYGMRRTLGKNLAHRMVGKFKVRTEKFWTPTHPGLPWEALFPRGDAAEKMLNKL